MIKERSRYWMYLSLFLSFALISHAQTDSTLSQVLLNLSANLSSAGNEWNIGGALPGLKSDSAKEHADFSAGFKALELRIFQDTIPHSSQYYEYLHQLPAFQKNRLIACFYQKEAVLSGQLEKTGLSQAFKFLPPALSGMNNRATGEDRRAGIWQLTHFQGVLNGLVVDRLMDERFDAGRATRAAVSELERNRETFGSEEMAALAFLAGPALLRNVVSQLPEPVDIDQIIGVLPESVSETIALWQAMAVFLSENQSEYLPEISVPDTVLADQQLHLQQVAQILNIQMGKLQNLNPQYPYSIVPGDQRMCRIYLPHNKKSDFLKKQDSIFIAIDSALFEMVAQKIEYPPAPTRQYLNEKVKDLEIEGKTKIRYTLKTGDVLGFIAEEYDVRIADLKYWNNIYNERKIQAGKKLDIFVDDDDADYYRKLHPEPITKNGAKNLAAARTYPIPDHAQKIEHVVKNGESPYVIARKYKGVTPDAILYWNGIADARKIQVGQKLTIYVSE